MNCFDGLHQFVRMVLADFDLHHLSFRVIVESSVLALRDQATKSACFPQNMQGGRVKLQCVLDTALRLLPLVVFGGDPTEQNVIAGVVAVSLMIGV